MTELARGGDLMESLQLHRNGFQDVSWGVTPQNTQHFDGFLSLWNFHEGRRLCGKSHLGLVLKNQEEHAKELILDVARGRMRQKTCSGISACFAWRFVRSRQPSHAGFGNAGRILGEHVTRMQDLYGFVTLKGSRYCDFERNWHRSITLPFSASEISLFHLLRFGNSESIRLLFIDHDGQWQAHI